MLRKKYVVQKSVRLDARLAEDLEALSTMVERPQNELVNLALENLMRENKYWFAQNIAVEYFSNFLDGGEGTKALELQALTITLEKKADKKQIAASVVKKDSSGKVVEQFQQKFDNRDELERELREWARYLELTSEMENYISHRLNYRNEKEIWSYL